MIPIGFLAEDYPLDFWLPNQNTALKPVIRTNPNADWRLYKDCGAPYYKNALTRESSACISSPSTNCLSGQSQNWSALGTPLQPHTHYFAVGRGYYTSGGSPRVHHRLWYKRYYYPPSQNCSYALDQNAYERYPVVPYPAPAMWPMPRPNPLRHAPSMPVPRQGWDEPEREKFRKAALQVSPDGKRRITARGRQRPRIDEHEPPKSLSRTQVILKTIFQIADVLSEWGELVDAFYKSINKDVRRAYEKKYLGGHYVFWRGRWHWWLSPGLSPKTRGFVDSAGQYGISGADYKAPAVWALRNHIDTDMAFRRILANVGEDALVGLIQRNIDPRVDRPLEETMSEINKAISGLTEKLAGVE